ncbi:hypothetical protein HDV57DRAFT_31096 [Trichoderma longibrachiatum]
MMPSYASLPFSCFLGSNAFSYIPHPGPPFPLSQRLQHPSHRNRHSTKKAWDDCNIGQLTPYMETCLSVSADVSSGRPTLFFFPARGPAPQASRFPVIRRILLPRVSIPARLLVFLVFSYRHIFQGTYCQLAEHTSLLFSLGFSRACVLLFSRSGLCDDVEILMIYEFVNCQDFDNWSFYLEELR